MTTSFGILASGVLEVVGGVLRYGGGGNPGRRFPAAAAAAGGAGMADVTGVAVLEALGSIPAARSLSSKEFGSGLSTVLGAAAGGGW
jgi:hypothetical protein